MSVKRIVALACIYIVAVAGWSILGTVTAFRSHQFRGRLGSQVETLWGSPLVQEAPSLFVKIPGTEQVRWIIPSQARIDIGLLLDYRKKGLIWYPTYVCTFDGQYEFTNTEAVAQKIRLHFDFPAGDATYDEFSVHLDGEELPALVDTDEGLSEIVELAPGQSSRFHVTYKTRGIREWRYQIDRNTGRVRDFSLVARTDFLDVDYPPGTLSPMSARPAGRGMELTWEAKDLITRQDIGVVIPEKLNPGPMASRIIFFAPVCLLFFFVLIATINLVYLVDIHPMHYLFVAAGFFAFHILLAYLVDHMDIHLAFAISSVVSVLLVTGYLYSSLRGKFPWKVAAGGQVFFLVLFSYSFFLKGMTGLTVAIGAVITLAIIMKVTAGIDWEDAFKKRREQRVAPRTT